MVKKILLALVMALPFCAWAQAPKFGVVDVQSVMQDMPELKDVEAKIAEASNSRKYRKRYRKNTPSSRTSTRIPPLSRPSRSAA